MSNLSGIIRIGVRNLMRYKRRTLLTGSLIVMGVVLVIVFGGLATTFKSSVIGVITNSSLSDMQIHKKGYVESVDNLPLDIYLNPFQMKKAEMILNENKKILAYSPRIRFGAMISNYIKTSSIRMTAIYPSNESKTCVGLTSRIKGIKNPEQFVNKGEVVLPEILFKGLSLKIGDEVVILSTNREGAVNGVPLKIAGVIESVMGPSGKDGYIHIEDAKDILRMDEINISEIAIHVQKFDELKNIKKEIAKALGVTSTEQVFEVHSWDQLAPFSNIAKMIDVLIIMVRLILISIVLISVMNIMMMSVYERTNEIGTIAAMGTVPHKILQIFLTEGVALGLGSAVIGSMIGVGILLTLNLSNLTFKFHTIQILLAPSILWGDVFWTIFIVLLISILGGFWPAYKASKMEPVDALRHV
ncbi:MAG: hypothetical protein A2381_11545 [Bdellovibrionales bacterium RIFOXYB1_FULL_37_110]|nr:MAG: hypothetical protein A2417_11850 [Bdellovibrionales bacterium RIFOXYC1_FULL_37_79]OFZ57324.1 MAG: hypothetical protein A2381_11545 [Bdellovibrionales bacterium RIFOXYB1_FULL_37_110]OFZ62220.1 MAG: hypothetical protein A2577_14095 [Bdellovibrionales bacterium RIFOXYD1_FULL_36_51]